MRKVEIIEAKITKSTKLEGQKCCVEVADKRAKLEKVKSFGTNWIGILKKNCPPAHLLGYSRIKLIYFGLY